jgi:hypothetical protein
LTELRQRRRNVNGAEFQNAYNRKQKRPTYWEAVECLVAGVRNPTHRRIQTGSQLCGHRHPQTIQKNTFVEVESSAYGKCFETD